MTAPRIPNLAAVLAPREVLPSAAEAVRCPACPAGWTYYETDQLGRTVECCTRCPRAVRITGRVVPLDPPRQGRRTDLEPRRRTPEPTRRREYPALQCEAQGCSVMVPQVRPAAERRRFCDAHRNAARTGRRFDCRRPAA